MLRWPGKSKGRMQLVLANLKVKIDTMFFCNKKWKTRASLRRPRLKGGGGDGKECGESCAIV